MHEAEEFWDELLAQIEAGEIPSSGPSSSRFSWRAGSRGTPGTR
jgi:hypothetical protein